MSRVSARNVQFYFGIICDVLKPPFVSSPDLNWALVTATTPVRSRTPDRSQRALRVIFPRHRVNP